MVSPSPLFSPFADDVAFPNPTTGKSLAPNNSTPSAIAAMGLQCLNVSLTKCTARPSFLSDETLADPPGMIRPSYMVSWEVKKVLSTGSLAALVEPVKGVRYYEEGSSR